MYLKRKNRQIDVGQQKTYADSTVKKCHVYKVFLKNRQTVVGQ